MLALRHAGRFAVDLLLFGIRSGRWWVLLLVGILVGMAAALTSAQVVVPVVTYTLF